MPATTRLISTGDAERLAKLQQSGRAFFEPWDPIRDDAYFTIGGQQAEVERALGRYRDGEALPHVIIDEREQVVGRITLSGITRGAFQSCSMGYWVAPEYNGRGYAHDAARLMTELAFDDLGLHRVQAETLPHNTRSQHVLQDVGFTRYGLAAEYLKIAGKWQDHVMYQLLTNHS
jgi:[ribosomal protein S5]-alanine N-acetyltransferase